MAIYTGTEGQDTLWGSESADVIDARGGDDTLIGLGGNDTLLGGAGNDSLDGGSGADSLTGGSGIDSFFFRLPEAAVDRVTDFVSALDELVFDNNGFTEVGAAGALTANDARFAAGAGFTSGRDASDRFVYDTSTGNLYYDADGNGAGASRLVATLQGAPAIQATDITVVGQSGVWIEGSAVADNLTGTRFSDTIQGMGGDDTLSGLAGVDTLDGGQGNDTYIVTAGDVIVADPGGIDTVLSAGSWALAPGSGLERLTLTGTAAVSAQGNNAHNRLEGNNAANTINGRAGNDTLFGMGGNDVFDISAGGTASYGNDVIDGGSGFDTIDFGAGAQSGVTVNLAAGTASGGGAAGAGSLRLTSIEKVFGGGFGDRIAGSSAANMLYGQGGNDTLIGGAGNDTLSGGAGNDFFDFTVAPSAANADRILDCVRGMDKLRLDDAAHANIGTLGSFAVGDGRFWAAPGAVTGHDASDRVVYNSSTGSLYYDADGSGAGASQLIVTLQGAPALSATDIAVI